MQGKLSNSQISNYALGLVPQSSVYGSTIPIIYGRARAALYLIWQQNLRQGGGSIKALKAKKGSPATYVENVDFLIGHNPIVTPLQFWQNNNQKLGLNMGGLYSQAIVAGGVATVTIPDTNFYTLLGVTITLPYSVFFNDYGSQGGETLSGTYELPLWNSAYAGPDRINISGWRWYPYTYRWVPGSGRVIDIDLNAKGLWPNCTINLYYAAKLTSQTPTSQLRLTFEPELGNGPEYSGYSSQQILYPDYAGLGSPNIDMGTGQAIPNIVPEILGAFPVYSTGDCDFADMIEDVFKGVAQAVQYNGSGYGPAYSTLHHGLDCYEYPGMIQKKLRTSASSFTTVAMDLPVSGGIKIVVARNDNGAPLSISSVVSGASWTPLIPGPPNGYQVWNSFWPGGTGEETITVTPGGANCDIEVMEFGTAADGLDTIDNTAVFNGTGGPIAGSIGFVSLQPGTVGYILAVMIAATGSGNIQPANPPSHWNNLMVGQGKTWSMYRIVKTPGTYSFSVQPSFTGSWHLLLVTFIASAPVQWPYAIGDILHYPSLQLVRNQCRANSLIGSMTVDSQRKGSDLLQDFYDSANAAPVWSGFKLKSIPWSEVSNVGNGATYTAPTAAGPVADLGQDDFVGDEKNPIVQWTRKAPSIDSWNLMQIQHPNRAGDYNDVIVAQQEQATIALYGARKDSPRNLRCVQDVAVGRMLLDIWVRRMNYIRDLLKGKLKANWKLLEPMDLVTITEPQLGLDHFPVRITSMVEDDKYNLDTEFEPFIYGVHSPQPVEIGTVSPYLPAAQYVPSLINPPVLFEPIGALAGFPTVNELWAVVSNPDGIGPVISYGGSDVYVSTDGGVSYKLIETIFGNGTTGVTAADWPSHTDPDTVNDLLLNLTESKGALSSNSVQDENGHIFPCYVASPESWTDLACVHNATALTSASGGFSQDLVDQSIRITAGTNLTPGDYPVLAWVSPNQITLASTPAPAANGSAGVGSVVSGTNPQPFIPYEIMDYLTATPTSLYHYTLPAAAGLRRASFSAPLPNQGVDHPAGSRFALLNPSGVGISKITLQPDWIGVLLNFKFVAFNQYGGGKQNLSDVVAYPFTPSAQLAAVQNANLGDSGVPDAPLVAVITNQADQSSSKYHMLVGIQNPGSPVNWNNIIGIDVQITSAILSPGVPDWSTFPAGQSMNLTGSGAPGVTESSPFFSDQKTFDTNFPGTYYIRARAWNGFGGGLWSGTGQVSTVSIAAGGSSYTIGDILGLVEVGGLGATVTVLTLGGGGAVASVKVTSQGTGYTTASNPLSTAGGTGTGCQINVLTIVPALSLSTNILDSTTADTGLVPGVTAIAQVQGANTAIGGNEIQVIWTVPSTNTATFWGTQIFAHPFNTLPTATTSITDKSASIAASGALTAGVALLTDAGASFPAGPGLIASNIFGIGSSVGSATQNNVPQFSTTGSGTGAKFNITENAGGYLVFLANPGSGYAAMDTILIKGTSLGGATPANDLTITVSSVLSGLPNNYDLVVFCPQRGGSPSFDYEGMIVFSEITASTSTTISFNSASQNLNRTVSGCKYYIVQRGAGNGFFEKVAYVSPWQLDPRITAPGSLDAVSNFRSFIFAGNISPCYIWVSMNNLFGQGPVGGSATATYLGMTLAEMGTNSVGTTQIVSGSVIASKLTANSQGWTTNIAFSASDYRTVAWTSGTIKTADGTTYAISSGNTGSMAAQSYIYLDKSASLTVLQVTTNYALVTGENVILLCVAKNTADTTQNAFFVPAVGTFGINSTVVGPNSIATGSIQALAITTGLLAAGSVTAAKISVVSLDAISVNAGTITAGTFIGTTFKTATSGGRIELDSTNGLRGYSSAPSLVTQIDLTNGYVLTTSVKGINSGLILQDNTAAGQIAIGATAMTFNCSSATVMQLSGGNLLTSTIQGISSGLTLEDNSAAGAITVGASLLLFKSSSTTVMQLDTGSLRVAIIKGISSGLILEDSTATGQLSLGSGGVTINSGASGLFVNSSSAAVLAISTSGTQINIGGTYYTLSVVAGVVHAT